MPQIGRRTQHQGWAIEWSGVIKAFSGMYQLTDPTMGKVSAPPRVGGPLLGEMCQPYEIGISDNS